MSSTLNYRKECYYIHRRNKKQSEYYDTEMVGWAKFRWIYLIEGRKFKLDGVYKNILIEK